MSWAYMKAVILAGGFAKRMWPLTKEKPKHLLPLAGKPMLSYVMEKLEATSELDRIFVSTNARFADQFSSYLATVETEKDVLLFVEKTYSEAEKLGSVGGLRQLVMEHNIDDELLVVGGDNIFGFEIADFIDFFQSKIANAVALYDLKSKAKARLYGVATIDNENKIICFQEKPDQPQSTLVSTACYAFTRKGVQNIRRYLEEGNDPDKMGHFVEWLCRNDDVYGYVFEGIWFDIGGFDSYDEANRYFSRLAIR